MAFLYQKKIVIFLFVLIIKVPTTTFFRRGNALQYKKTICKLCCILLDINLENQKFENLIKFTIFYVIS